MRNGPVVVGYDKTPQGDRALAMAALESGLRRSTLVVVHAYSGADALPAQERKQREVAEEIARTAADLIAARHPDLRVEAAAGPGDAARVLAAAGRGADLLVVGHRDDDAVPSAPASVAVRVLAEALCPVLIVRGGERPEQSRVLVLLDIEEDCDDLLRFAFASASRRGAAVTAVNVWEEPWALESSEIGAASEEIDAIAAERTNRLERLVRPWHSRFPDVPAASRMRIGAADKLLAEASQEADLLVVGAHRYGHRREGMRVGPIANSIVHRSTCPVEVVPLE